MPDIVIYTDGSCLGNPGPGGWAAILVAGSHRREISGHETATTNNSMELMAVLQGVSAILRKGASVEIVTDSEGVIGWCTGKWRAKKPHIAELRDKIKAVAAEKNLALEFKYVKGHNGHGENERADALASEQAHVAAALGNSPLK